MIVLAMDTSSELTSVAVSVDGVLRAELSARVLARHGETLLPLVERGLELSGVALADLGLLAVGLGPGSFTGTRVGIATAKGLSLARDLPLVGVGSHEAIAVAAPGDHVAVVVDAYKGEVYLGIYEREAGRMVERLAPDHATPEDARARLPEGAVVVGSGARRYREVFGDVARGAVFDAPRAGVVAFLGVRRFEERGADDRAALEPRYVRPPDITPPRDKR